MYPSAIHAELIREDVRTEVGLACTGNSSSLSKSKSQGRSVRLWRTQMIRTATQRDKRTGCRHDRAYRATLLAFWKGDVLPLMLPFGACLRSQRPESIMRQALARYDPLFGQASKPVTGPCVIVAPNPFGAIASTTSGRSNPGRSHQVMIKGIGPCDHAGLELSETGLAWRDESRCLSSFDERIRRQQRGQSKMTRRMCHERKDWRRARKFDIRSLVHPSERSVARSCKRGSLL